ncbi:hypothetical protein [Xanthobacter sp. KR7-225]|uniref:hypothetical protein n=1 Tax=Xanthobacter sp. KR7-225 TaxID=3156613 RepID=UPI0032B3179C
MRAFAGLILAAVFLSPAVLAPRPALAGELLMFERKGCVYCLKFDHEVAPIYEKTDEGRRAPLRRVDLGLGLPAGVALASPVRFSPTFVLVDHDREVGRITGYASDEAFWGLLGAITNGMASAQP